MGMIGASTKKMPEYVGPLGAVVLLALILSVISPSFLKVVNIMNILRQTAINALVALGILMVMLTGGIDLSVGAVAVLSGCSMGVLLKNGVTSAPLLIAAGLGVGLLCGALNAVLYTQLGLPHPFVSTMGTKMLFRGLALFITKAAPISGFSPAILFLGYRNLFKVIPAGFALVVILYIIAGVVLGKTAFGRKIYSVGGNREAARLSGINVKKILNSAYIISGFMASVAGIVLLGRISSASPIAAETADMDAIASCVVGGTSFLGGKGTVAGTLAGALLIGVINNGLDLLGAQTDAKYMVIGSVVVLAVALDVLRNKAEERARRLAQAKVVADEA